MMEDKNLVRHLEACETMGGATNICSDKTGTLTENRMTVVEAYLGDEHLLNVDHKNFKVNEKLLDLFSCSVSVCSTAFWSFEENKNKIYVGSKTECALLEFIEKSNYNFIEIRKKIPVVKMFPFNSSKKRMTSITQDQGGKIKAWCKGAPENLIKLCDFYLDSDNNAQKMNNEKCEEMLKQVEQMASKGLRTIAIAFATLDQPSDWEDFKEPEAEYTLIGFCGIKDPVRKDVPDAVASCQKAGIFVRMLTGKKNFYLYFILFYFYFYIIFILFIFIFILILFLFYFYFIFIFIIFI